jgi:hypothetical protein
MDKAGKIIVGVILVALLAVGIKWVFTPSVAPPGSVATEITALIPGVKMYDKKTGKLYGYVGDISPEGYKTPDGKRVPGLLVKVAGSSAPEFWMSRTEAEEKYFGKFN